MGFNRRKMQTPRAAAAEKEAAPPFGKILEKPFGGFLRLVFAPLVDIALRGIIPGPSDQQDVGDASPPLTPGGSTMRTAQRAVSRHLQALMQNSRKWSCRPRPLSRLAQPLEPITPSSPLKNLSPRR